MSQPGANGTTAGKKGINWSPLWKLEDWWAVWFAFIGIILAATGILTSVAKFNTWTSLGEAFPEGIWTKLLLLLVGLGIISGIGVKLMGQNVRKYLIAFPVVFLLAGIAQILAANSNAKAYNLETALWGLIVGLLISNTVKTPYWLKPAVKTKCSLKPAWFY